MRYSPLVYLLSFINLVLKGLVMSIEIIGAGFGRTGTLSLKYALEKLGYNKTYHMAELIQNPDD